MKLKVLCLFMEMVYFTGVAIGIGTTVLGKVLFIPDWGLLLTGVIFLLIALYSKYKLDKEVKQQ